MSLLPYQFTTLWPTTPDPFGLNLWRPVEYQLLRPLESFGNQLRLALSDLEKEANITSDGTFQVSVDVNGFAPNELSVKTVNNSIIVEAKHEERRDEHGYISRQFTRRYDLPEGFKVEDVVSNISSDGVLTIKAPPANQAIEGSKVRQIPLQHTGPAHLSVTKNKKTDEDEKKTKSK